MFGPSSLMKPLSDFHVCVLESVAILMASISGSFCIADLFDHILKKNLCCLNLIKSVSDGKPASA